MVRNKITAAAIALFCCLSGFSQEGKDGWTSLFNGRDLTGFRQLNGKAKYEVKNGEIVGTNVDKEPNSFLATNETYGDFILELELFVDPAMNSGVQFRSQSIASFKEGRVHGYQMEIDPSNRAWSGAIFDEGRRGWLYTLDLNPVAKTAFKNNQWNKYRIECIGNTIRTWVNGIPTAHLIDDMTAEGFIALQVHSVRKNELPGKQIRWRNIRIKTTNLKPSPYDNIFVVNLIPNSLSVQEKNNGFRMLWDGKTGNGWEGINTKSFPGDRWSIKDGELAIVKAGGTSSVKKEGIITADEFSSFELKFDFKLSEGANSGVQYFVSKSNAKSATAPEYQLIDDSKNSVEKENRLASLYGIQAPTISDERFIRKAGEWNEAVIKVQPGNKVEYWLNGLKVLEYDKLNSLGLPAKGRILLQDDGSEVSFRSIKIRRLK
ncbi:MAG: 3-keto-disaccharide hydrolase [Chitinophagaceae bacterium]